MSFEENRPSPLKVHELELETEVLKDSSRGHLDKEATYLIYKLLEFPDLVQCNVCRRPHQTGKLVGLRNLRTGKEINSGLNCLDKNFNINVKDLETNTIAKKRLVIAWQRYVGSVFEGKTLDLTDKEWFALIAEFLVRTAHFNCPAAEELAQDVNRMLGDWSAVTVGDYDTTIDKLIVFLSLQRDHRDRPEFFADQERAYLNHPRLKDKPRIPFRQFFKEPQSLTRSQLAQLIYTGDKVKKQRRWTLKVEDLKPYNFPSQSTYEARLTELAKELADNAPKDIERSPLQIAKDKVRDFIRSIKKGGLELHAFSDHARSKVADMNLPVYLRAEAQEVGGDLYFSDRVHEIQPRTIRMETGSVRSMQRSAQLEDEEERDESTPDPIYYRAVVVWKPDLWYDAYDLWFKYGGVNEGRGKLEDLRSILDTTH